MVACMTHIRYLKLYIFLILFFEILSASTDVISVFIYLFFAGASIIIILQADLSYIKLPNCNILRLIRYLPWLLKELILSSWNTILVILNIKKIAPVIIKQPVTSNNMIDTIYANSVTLTPGTLTIALSPKEIQVHALNKEFMADLLQSSMYKKVKDIGDD